MAKPPLKARPLAQAFGGVESLIEHRASVEDVASPCPADLLRLSVGIEDPDDRYAALDRALRSTKRRRGRHWRS